jgi:hypothetical protein
MMLISGDEKPLGYFKKQDPLENAENDKKKPDKEKQDKTKKESGDNKGKVGADKLDEYYSNYFDKEFIKLAKGKKMRKGLENTVTGKKAITFEVFKDELEL